MTQVQWPRRSFGAGLLRLDGVVLEAAGAATHFAGEGYGIAYH